MLTSKCRSLSSGTGYAFGLIASPIAERLGLSATAINFVGTLNLNLRYRALMLISIM